MFMVTNCNFLGGIYHHAHYSAITKQTRMWVDAQHDGCPA